jgi:hypothetical protein
MSIRALHRSEIDRAAELLQRMVTEIAALGGPPTKGKAEVERWFSDRIRETSDDPIIYGSSPYPMVPHTTLSACLRLL